jgi:hypothetical protein
MVGIFWVVGDALVAAGCSIAEGEQAGDWIDYPGGHADYWERWQEAGAAWLTQHGLPAAILSSEYDEHPRGRIVFDRRGGCFLLYADRRLQTPATITRIRQAFGLGEQTTRVLSDPHYRQGEWSSS